MVAITEAETLLLNTEPQETDLYLSIYEPSLALICQITGSSYSASNQTVNYYNTVSGSYTNILSYNWEVALVGTAPNDDSLGRTWLRSANPNTLRFVESDHINWDNATYVTVLKYIEIIPIFPRIIQNPSNEEDVIFYKMWDVAYTNQNSILGTFVNMGSNFASFLENGTGTCYWSASGTTNVIGDNVTYSWMFEGATVTGSTAHTPGYITYNQPGHFRTILTVTSASGKIDRASRFVSFYNRPGEGNNVPILNWEVTDWGGDRDAIGYSCRIKVRENVSKTKIRDGGLIVIFGDDWYGSTKQSVSNSQKGRENIKFVGYIVGDTIQYNYADGWVEFECVSPTNFMEMCECFSCSVESKTSPATWFELLNMDVRRAVYHYLAWQSTVIACCDIEFKNFTDRNIQYFDADRTSLYDAINTLLDNARVGKLVSDSLGKLWFEQEVSVINNVSPTLVTALSIAKKDWIGEPVIDERQHQEVSYLESGGIYYSLTSGESAAFLSGAPGISPAYRGKAESRQGLALLNQAELNTINGNLFAYMNSRYPNIELSMRANLNNIDIAPQEKVLLTIASEDTPRNITFTNKAFTIRGKRISWDGRTKRCLVNLSLAEITQGFTGDTIIIPIEPPGPENPPGRPPPRRPPPPPPVIPPPVLPPSEADAIVVTSTDVRISRDFDGVTPSWTSIISGGPTTPIDSDLPETNNDILYVIEAESVWKCSGLNTTPAWSEVWTGASLTLGTIESLTRVRVAPGTDSLLYVLGWGVETESGGNKPFVIKTANGGATWTESWLPDVLSTGTPYTVTIASATLDHPVAGIYHYAEPVHTRIGDDENTVNPWAMAIQAGVAYGIGLDPQSYTIDSTVHSANDISTVTGKENNLLSSGDQITAAGWLTDYFGSYTPFGGTPQYPLDAARIKVRFATNWGANTFSTTVTSWVFWNKPDIQEPTALDVSRSNNNWVYVGTTERIWKSLDGGTTWIPSIEDHGSNDVHLEPMNADVYYSWATDGSLETIALDTVLLPDFTTETAVEVGLRLARDLDGERIWALKSGTTLWNRTNGANADQSGGFVGARGLHAYVQGKLIFLDNSDIYYSSDGGTTQTVKKGSWSTYSGPINAHLMRLI